MGWGNVADQFVVDLPTQTVKILEGAQPLPPFEVVTEKIGKTGKVVSRFWTSFWKDWKAGRGRADGWRASNARGEK